MSAAAGPALRRDDAAVIGQVGRRNELFAHEVLPQLRGAAIRPG
ncbi:hypothetical protein [Trebonia sp.]|nr:hypothetical protein [Trebonia sp.]